MEKLGQIEGGVRHGDNANSYYDDPHTASTVFSA
jgi:hypothetical protein